MRPLAGYPDSFGNNRASVAVHAGPASYTQVVVGVAPAVATLGDALRPSEAGVKFFDAVMSGVSDSGCFLVLAIPTQRSATTTTGPLSGQQCSTYTLKWVSLVTATVGGQAQTAFTEAVAATNLSAEVVRLFVLGPK